MKNVFNFISLLCLSLILAPSSDVLAGEYTETANSFKSTNKRIPNQALQEELRAQAPWQAFVSAHNTWRVHFNEENARPHRAYGKGISTMGATLQDRAMNFIVSELGDFTIPLTDLRLMGESTSPSHYYVNYYQEHNGLKVLNSRMMVKMTKDHKVIMYGADVYTDIAIGTSATLSVAQVEAHALNATQGTNLTPSANPGLFILPIPMMGKNEYRLVYEVLVDGMDPEGILSSFYTLVDAHNGEVLLQFNLSHTHAPKADIEATVTADIYPKNAYDTPVNMPLRDLRIRINSVDYYTDTTGFLTTGINTASTGTVFLDGPWVEITTSGQVPQFTTSLVAGPNTLSFNSDALDTERNAFYHINRIHDWVNTVIAGFTGMDYQVTVNMDQTGTCNASFGGGQMNFYLQGGGCYSLATIADVIYHEYGHGTNTAFYNDNSGFFQNGALHEGYADVWGFSRTLNSILGEGMSDTDPTVSIRRYDIDPKIYPDDLVGQVHADGEIIAGAWWDLYLNLDSNMTQTMDLFEDAYYGLQAVAADGQEGQAFRDVLLDVLQADDDDGNLANGTPNITDICDAFGKHGITLISNATLIHTDVTSANTGQLITIDASLNLSATTYLGNVMLYYKLKDDPTWTSVVMGNTGGSNYSGTIPGQVPGAIVAYYIGVTDNNCGNLSAVQPVGADGADPTLPYFVLVDYAQEELEDFDNNSLSGFWTYGISADDATTGLWALEVPEGMFDNGYELAPTTQSTQGGFSCAVTGLNTSGQNGSIGQDDVDDGATTLLTPELDLTAYYNPVISYRRWFANASPSSANPGNDPWYVEITSDGSTWVPVEFTYVGDNNWRRYAFNVEDYVVLSANVQVKFQVSDSIILALGPSGCAATPFCGGSLLEAGLDNFKIWSQISQPIIMSVTGVSCNGDCDGEVTATPDTGIAPYTYLWDDPSAQTTAIATGLCGGTYEVMAIDALNDTLIATVFVVEPAVLAVTASGTNSTCPTCNNGTATATVTGGTVPYNYSWNDAMGQATVTATGLNGGSVICQIVDANGCSTSSNNVIITVGLEERLVKGSVRLFPNPARDIVQLSFSILKEGEVSISMVDYLGREVYSEHLRSRSGSVNNLDISIGDLTAGVYTLKLLAGSQLYSRKVNVLR